MKYSYNCLLKWHDGKTSWLERVLWIEPSGQRVACIKINPEPTKQEDKSGPFWRTKSELDKEFAAQNVRVLDKDPFLTAAVHPDTLTEKTRLRWEKIWTAIEPIVQDPNRRIFFSRAEKRGLVARAAKECGLDKSSVYRLLRKCWVGGQTPQCVLPDYKQCGGRTRKFRGGNKRGRRSVLEKEKGEPCGVVVTEEVRKRIIRGLDTYHYSSERRTMEETYTCILESEFSNGFEIVDGVQVPILLPEDERPTLRQVKYVYSTTKDPEREARTREGEKSFSLTGRAILGNTETDLSGPGAVGQMDATTADIYLRSEHDPELIVGRPTIYGIKDAWGRFLYSLTATFERPSYWGAAIALENALVNKVEYCAQYGITIGENEWPVDFLPEKLLVDRGEMSTYKSDHLVTGLGVRIGTLPPGRGDLKGIIEQQFRLLNLQLINWLPGALPRFRDDTKKRHELDAVYTISQFRRLLIQATLNFHRRLLGGRYKLSADMIAAGVQKRPIELLKWGIENRSGLFRKFPLDQARYHLLPHATAKVTDQGVRLQGAYFTFERAVRERWYERARRYGDYDVTVAFDPRRMDQIYFQISKDSTVEVLGLTQADLRFRNWTWEELEEHRKKMRLIEAQSRHQELQAKVELNATARQLAAEVRVRIAAAEAANPIQSTAEQLRNISENRAAEKADERARTDQSNAPTPPVPEMDATPSNVIQLPSAKPIRPTPPPPAVSELTKKLQARVKKHLGTE